MLRMIVSDIHGSYAALRKVVNQWEILKAEQIILLGDLLYHGPRNDLPEDYNPKQCIALFNSLKEHIVAVRGNCDAEVDQMVLDFPLMSDYKVLENDGHSIFLTHGHLYSETTLPALRTGDIFLSGHTHLPVMYEQNGIHFLNPGSISIPKGGSAASFGLLEGNRFQLMSLHGECLATYICEV